MLTDENMTFSTVLTKCIDYLTEKGDANPRLSSEWLICNVAGLTRSQLYLKQDTTLSKSELACLQSFIERRAAGEPLQYITGEMPFRYLVFHCERGVLIPRPETEILVDKALEFIDKKKSSQEKLHIIEVGVGTGCISCSIAYERPDVYVVGTDISPTAANLARKNAEALGLSKRVQVIECDLLSGVPNNFKADILVSNPPYIPTNVIGDLDKEVSDYEPNLALDGGIDGMDIFRRLIQAAPSVLKPEGVIIVELFEENLDLAKSLLEEDGRWKDIEIIKDLTGRPRHISAVLA